MQKMKFDLYNRIINDNTLTRNELHFLFWLAAHQDTSGLVTGVYYADMAKDLNVSISGFYFVRDSLVQKGYITWDKNFQADMDIQLSGNSFLVDGEAVYKNYVDLNITMFTNNHFFACKAGAIRLAMYLVKRVEAAEAVTMANSPVYSGAEAEKARKLWFHPMKQFKVLKSILRVDIRSIKEYFKELKEWIGNADIQKDGIVYSVITVLKESLIRPENQKTKVYAERKSYIQKVKVYCRRMGIFTSDTDRNLTDTADLIRQYQNLAKEAGCNILTLLYTSIERVCTETLNSYNVHKALRDLINYHAPELLTIK